MLPTKGFFKAISCPFYESCICERPFCHFKHSKNENIDNEQALSEIVNQAVHKILTAEKNLKKLEDSKSRTEKIKSRNITYSPTPLSQLNKYKNGNDYLPILQ